MSFQFKTISSDKVMKSAISERITKLLKKNGYTQLQLSRMMHVSKSTVSNWVHGEALTLDAIYNLAQFFDCSIDYLINGIGSSTRTYNKIVDDYGISNEVKYFYKEIQDMKVNGLSLTEALNYLISEDIFRRADGTIMFTNLDFAETWTAYLSIDPELGTDLEIYDNALRLEYTVDYATIAELELLKLTKILREKKEFFKYTNAFQDIHREKVIRKDTIYAEEELAFKEECGEYLQGTEPSPQAIKKWANIADPDNPVPWEKGGIF